MLCQTEGCNEEALYGVQVMSNRGYRVAMCHECAMGELIEVGVTCSLDMIDSTYSFPVMNAHWWKPHFHYDNIGREEFDRLQREKLVMLSKHFGVEKAKELLKIKD